MFVDAGAFVAWYRQSDEWHKAATAAWKRLEKSKRLFFTSALVVDEAMRGVARYGGIRAATQFGRAVMTTPELTILHATAEDELAALDLMDKYADQLIGHADCVSFVLMKRNRLQAVFGFDRHFRTAGFRLWPEQK